MGVIGYLPPGDTVKPKSSISTPVHHPGGLHQGAPLGRHLEYSYLGPRSYPGGRRRPINSNQEPIPSTHQLGVILQVCGRIQYHEGKHGQYVVHEVPLATGKEGYFGLEQKTEPFHLQVPPQIIKEGNNPQEYQQGQKTPSLWRLTIW